VPVLRLSLFIIMEIKITKLNEKEIIMKFEDEETLVIFLKLMDKYKLS